MDAFKDIIAGTMAGFFSKVIEYPFDTVKVRLQTTPEKYKNAVDCFRIMTKTEGPVAVFRGLPAPLVGAMAENSIVFFGYSGAGRLLFPKTPKHMYSPSQVALASAISGVAVACWLTPVEYVKCRLQAKHTSKMYNSAFDCLMKTVYEKRGVLKLSTGLSATMGREVPGAVMYFGAYEGVKYVLAPNQKDLPLWKTMVSGGAAGVAYWSAIYPIDLVKSRMQTSENKSGTLSFRQEFIRVYRSSGATGLYKGIGVTVPRAVISNAVIFGVYEQTLKQLDNMFPKQTVTLDMC